ncbi:MAG: peptidylprolyl isomerase, partial [Flavobacteriaceae bacterium]|nr:peptidylprolyl isomerase [Flavobacteriaceae bacterium]
MRVKGTLILVFLLFFNLIFPQQESSQVLFTVADTPVTAKEFERVYKKNLDLVQDPSQKEIDTYLDLYINYHLKLQEARRLGLHEEASYQREFINYKNQLIDNYLTDNQVTEKLVKEAYKRISEDVKAVHILIKLDPTSTDTMEVYKRLKELRPRLKNEDFDLLQSELHDGNEVFVEDLGYFTAFRMVYPFETSAYNTPVGEVSMPFRTSFGYHIVKVLDRRPARGQVTVSHIMVSNRQEDSTIVPSKRINEIYKKYLQNGNFESLAQQFSDDKGSAEKGGVLAPFEGGQLASQRFEEVAFGLEEVGEVSEPFETQFGWHIVKLIDKQPLGTFEEMEGELQVKVRRDSRSEKISTALIQNLKSQYNTSIDDKQVEYFKSILTPSYFERGWKLPDDFKVDTKLGAIEDFTLTNQAFGQHLLDQQGKYYKKQLSAEEVVDFELKRFLDEQLLGYHKNNLEKVDEDFAFVLREYRDGLLLFDLMEKEIWNVA